MCYFIPYFMRHFSYYKIKKYFPLLLRFDYFLVLLLDFHLLITFLPYDDDDDDDVLFMLSNIIKYMQCTLSKA